MKRQLGAYREWEAPTPLGRMLECIWTYRTEATARRAGKHRVLPHTGVSLCWSLHLGSDGRVLSGELEVFGPLERPRIFEPEPGLCLHAVRIKPEWTRFLLGLHAPDIRNEIVPWPAHGRKPAARDQLLGRSSSGDAMRALLELVQEIVETSSPGDRPPGVAQRALEMLRSPSTSPGVRVGKLARSLGASDRHLRRAISRFTALSPKRFQRIERLNRLIEATDRTDGGEALAWSDLAVRHGYCDQAHMIREVGSLTGATPSQLYEERRTEARVGGGAGSSRAMGDHPAIRR